MDCDQGRFPASAWINTAFSTKAIASSHNHSGIPTRETPIVAPPDIHDAFIDHRQKRTDRLHDRIVVLHHVPHKCKSADLHDFLSIRSIQSFWSILSPSCTDLKD